MTDGEFLHRALNPNVDLSATCSAEPCHRRSVYRLPVETNTRGGHQD
jgi:hypothetical protein